MALENLTREEIRALGTENLTNYVEELNNEIGANGLLPEKYCAVWKQLKIALIIAKMFTPDSVDKIIDEVIKAGDTTCGNNKD